MVKFLEHRRHAQRDKGGTHLNQQGVNLARSVGSEMGNFAYVVTSTIERAIQTAVAMGYAVNETKPELNTYGEDVHSIFSAYPTKYPTRLNTLTIMYNQYEQLRQFASEQLDLYYESLGRVDEGKAVLLVSHGGVIDLPLMALFPGRQYKDYILEAGYCEGYRIGFDRTLPISLELLRL